MKKLEIAVVGAGVIGKRHVELASSSRSCRLAAICDENPAAKVLARTHHVPFFSNVETMLKETKLDGAIVATPNDDHAAVGISCAEHGIDLLVEKPIASTSAEAELLVEAASRNDTELIVGHHRRFNPIVRKTRTLIEEGSLGRLLSATFLWLIKKPRAYYDVPWRIRRPGGGFILINLIHEIDTLRYICGEIKSLYAVTGDAARGLEVEDTASVSFAFENGAVGTISASDAVPAPWSWEMTMAENPMYFHAPGNFAYVCGSKASLAIPSMELRSYANEEEEGWEDRLESRRVDVEQYDPLVSQLEHFCRVILREEKPVVSGADALRTLTATLAVTESARLGRPIELS